MKIIFFKYIRGLNIPINYIIILHNLHCIIYKCIIMFIVKYLKNTYNNNDYRQKGKNVEKILRNLQAYRFF
jgi:hypothetical protein